MIGVVRARGCACACVNVHRGPRGRTCTFGILVVLHYQGTRPRHQKANWSQRAKMDTESDDEPQGNRAESSSLTCAMCGDVFDYCEVGTFPSGG